MVKFPVASPLKKLTMSLPASWPEAITVESYTLEFLLQYFRVLFDGFLSRLLLFWGVGWDGGMKVVVTEAF